MAWYFDKTHQAPDPEQPQVAWRRIGRYMAEFKGGIASSLALGLIGTLLFVLLPFPVKYLIDGVLVDDRLELGWLGSWETVTTSEKMRVGAVLAAAYVLLSVLQITVNAASFYLLARTALLMIHTLRSRLVGHLRALSLRYFANTSVGELIFRAINDARAIQEVMIFGLSNWALLVFRMGLMAVFMSFLDPVLTLIALTVVPALALAMRLLARRIQRASSVSREEMGKLTSHIEQTVGAIRAVQVFGDEGNEREQFDQISHRFVRAQLTFRWAEQKLNVATVSITAIATGLVLLVAVDRVGSGAVTVGGLWVFITYMQGIYQMMNQIMFVFGPMQDAAVGVSRAFRILDTPPDIVERPGARDAGAIAQALVLEGVALVHTDGRRALDGIDLVVRRGEKVALIGETGSGKTSILNLIPRLHDVTTGRILIDGTDTRDLTLTSLRAQVSLVPQEPLLFAASIRDNVRYGRLGATDDEVEAAVRAAQAHDFVVGLPAGYDTQVGDRGMRLSMGQQQRIAIARAFLKDAPILLLDEPTSALDAATEAGLLDSLDTLMAGRTVIIVAHRLSTIRSVDRIYLLEAGHVIEQGTHDELIATNGRYRELWDRQFAAT